MIKFNGDWSYHLKLTELCKLNSDRFFGYESRKKQKENLLNGILPITISDARDLNPDPLPEQIQTISWILSNQDLIMETLFESVISIIFPYYKNKWGDEENEESYPKLGNKAELNKALGIDSISIQTFHKEQLAYYTIYFDFCTDEEHGLAIAMHKSRLISFGAIGDIDDKEVIEDLGLNYEKWLNDQFTRQQNKKLVYHKPLDKYKKFKPWQEQENRYYPYGLFHMKRDDELIKFIEEGNITVDGNSTTFLELAIRLDRDIITTYCLGKNPIKLYKPFLEAMKKDNFDLMNKILDLGFLLNSEIAQMSPLYIEIGNLANQLKGKEDVSPTLKRINYLFAKGIDPYLQDRFGRDAFYRIKRIDEESIKSEVLSIVKSISKNYMKGQ